MAEGRTFLILDAGMNDLIRPALYDAHHDIVRVAGSGSYVPDAVVTNDHLRQRFGFDSDWIVKRTGILERRHALAHQATSDLCH